MTVVRDSTFIGDVVMDAIDARPNQWSLNLHGVPRDEFEEIQRRARERGGNVESINDGGVAIEFAAAGSFSRLKLWPACAV